MEGEIKGKLTVIKPTCKQIVTIYKEAYKSMAKLNQNKIFWDICNDLGGTKWEFEKFD